MTGHPRFRWYKWHTRRDLSQRCRRLRTLNVRTPAQFTRATDIASSSVIFTPYRCSTGDDRVPGTQPNPHGDTTTPTQERNKRSSVGEDESIPYSVTSALLRPSSLLPING
ncbi:unnamed protein product [Sphacelaria rigidula]